MRTSIPHATIDYRTSQDIIILIDNDNYTYTNVQVLSHILMNYIIIALKLFVSFFEIIMPVIMYKNIKTKKFVFIFKGNIAIHTLVILFYCC